MNELCKYFNIFEDKDIIEFIKMKGMQRYISLRAQLWFLPAFIDKEYMRQYF